MAREGRVLKKIMYSVTSGVIRVNFREFRDFREISSASPWGCVSVVIFEEHSNAVVNLPRHRWGVILAVQGVLATRRLVLVMFIDASAFSVKVWQDVGYVSGKSPWLLEKVAFGPPRGLEVVLTAVEIGEEEVHLLHKSTNTMLLPVGTIPRPFDDQVDPIGGVRRT